MITLGIDIGVTGAISALDAAGNARIEDLPTVTIPGTRTVRRKLSAKELIWLVRALVPADGKAVAFIEDVHAIPGNGSAATQSLAFSRGVVEAVLEIARIEVRAVQPATWKRWYSLTGKHKAASLHTARTLFPAATDRLKLQKHHNRAESLLIAHYGRRVEA